MTVIRIRCPEMDKIHNFLTSVKVRLTGRGRSRTQTMDVRIKIHRLAALPCDQPLPERHENWILSVHPSKQGEKNRIRKRSKQTCRKTSRCFIRSFPN
ncbi:hypothetical protein R3I94_012291 [Phoxinus phoxinus]